MPGDDGLPWIDATLWPMWRLRVCAEHAAGDLTPARCDALTTLLRLLCTGDAEPSDAEVAEAAHCSARTVRRARADARELGLLRWQRTRQLRGTRVVQGRNRYAINVPAGPVCPRVQADRPAAQARLRREKEIQDAPRTLPRLPPHIAAAALEAIRRRRAAALGVSG